MKRLYDLAYGRSGDKGNTLNISVIARTSVAYQELKRKLTADQVKAYLGNLAPGKVVRYECDHLEALNFVLYNALDGGATRSLRVDTLGKSLAGALFYMPWELA